MSTPGIELRWGDGFEGKPRKCEAVRPFVRDAIELAEEELYNLGIPLDERKYVVVDQAPPGEVDRAYAVGSKTCHLLLSAAEARRGRFDTIWRATDLLHEFVHLTHFQHGNGFAMLDHAASEGLAYIAQANFFDRLLAENNRSGPPHRIVRKVLSQPKRDLRQLEADFWKASARPDANSMDNMDKWFTKCPRPLGFPRGATFGVFAVSRQLKIGWEIPELITMSPYDVLDAA